MAAAEGLPEHPAAADVAVVTVSYRSAEVLPSFLDSLADATSRSLSVVIADNAAPDAAVSALAGRHGRLSVQVFDTGGNLGYGRGANYGARQTTARFLVVANPDIRWHPGALDALLAAATRWPKGGALGPVIHTQDGQLYPSARELPSLVPGIGHALLARMWPANPWTTAYRREREQPTERPAGWLSGSCLLLRRAAFDAVGGFDPSYFMYFEDVDLGRRLGEAGWQNVYVPSAQVTHLGGHSASQHSARMASEHHASAYRYLARRYRGWRWWPVRVALRTGLAVRSLFIRLLRQ